MPVSPPAPLDPRTEATVRRLRTLLEEARGMIQLVPDDALFASLDRRIEALQHEAEHLAPDFAAKTIRNGVSGS